MVIPYGIYDLKRNAGYISVGTSKDTSEFACDSVAWWWAAFGRELYPGADSICLLCDGGGSNSASKYLFKEDLQELSDRLGIEIRVTHYPPYCWKYNPIEHRPFPHVTRACRGVIFRGLETVRYYMAQAATATGLEVGVSAGFEIFPGQPAAVSFRTSPGSSFTAGTILTPAVEVELLDAAGNFVSSATDSVTVTLGNNTNGGTLSGTTTVSAIGGVATFANLSVDNTRSNYVLTASGTSLASSNSATFDITADVAVDQLPEPDEVRTQAQFLQRWGIDDLVDEGRAAWAAAASAPTVAALAMRSRVREAEALLDPAGLGGFLALTFRVGPSGQ